ncbi:hypothetical protein KIL84_021785, partial [Mauremys mutica]
MGWNQESFCRNSVGRNTAQTELWLGIQLQNRLTLPPLYEPFDLSKIKAHSVSWEDLNDFLIQASSTSSLNPSLKHELQPAETLSMDKMYARKWEGEKEQLKTPTEAPTCNIDDFARSLLEIHSAFFEASSLGQLW